jgi:azurin
VSFGANFIIMTVKLPALVCLFSLSLANVIASAGAPPQKAPAAGRTIEITVNDQMRYDVATITAKPGETLKIRLHATGSMPKNIMSHNLVVLKKTADVNAFVTKANTANATGYMPTDLKPQVIAASGLIGNGETTEVTFKAPAAPGTYPYLCTFPGHYAAGMKGTLVVK